MVERSRKPSGIAVSSPTVQSGLVDVTSDAVKLSLPTGESVEILLYGATITSWKAGDEEKLFLSEKAVLDGSKAVRGGIPLVFPIFGKSDKSPELPQHGFARVSRWEYLGKTSESESSIQVDLGLSAENVSPELRKAWPSEFGLIYSVTLGKKTLATKMIVRNEGESPFEFQVLFHTYFMVPKIEDVAISGLEGTTYQDKVAKTETTESSSDLQIGEEVDRVYQKVKKNVAIKSGSRTLVTVERSNLDDVVVWNPWTGASKMADFGPEEGYKNMVCVEAGTVSEWQKLDGGETWEGGQVLSLE